MSSLLIFFFYEKILNAQKAPKHKRNDFYPLRSFCGEKIVVAFLVFCSLIFVLLVDFCLICVFVRLTSFLKTKNKQAWNCPNNLIYNTTDVYPHLSTYREFICTHLYGFMKTFIINLSKFLLNTTFLTIFCYYC